eukprot:14928090-Alexandrium_andersonii.AAC.1
MLRDQPGHEQLSPPHSMRAPPICFLRVAQDCRILRNHMRLLRRPHRGPRRCPAARKVPQK